MRTRRAVVVLAMIATALFVGARAAEAAPLSPGCQAFNGDFGAISELNLPSAQFNAGDILSVNATRTSTAATAFKWTDESSVTQVTYTAVNGGFHGTLGPLPVPVIRFDKFESFGAPSELVLACRAGQAPTLTPPANITASAAPGSCAKQVFYPDPTITGDPKPRYFGSPASGSTFPVGTNIVSLTATNLLGTATGAFTITVVDDQPPTIRPPANITVNAVSPAGAVVTYPAPFAADNCAGVRATCAPPSGSTFAAGVTRVTCTARDTAGLTSSTSFTVTVKGPLAQLDALVAQAGPAFGKSRLVLILQHARDALARRDTRTACTDLRQWVQIVQLAGGPPDAVAMIPAVQQVRGAIGC